MTITHYNRDNCNEEMTMKIEGLCVYQSPFDLCSFRTQKTKNVTWMCGRVKVQTMCKWEITAREKGGVHLI